MVQSNAGNCYGQNEQQRSDVYIRESMMERPSSGFEEDLQTSMKEV